MATPEEFRSALVTERSDNWGLFYAISGTCFIFTAAAIYFIIKTYFFSSMPIGHINMEMNG